MISTYAGGEIAVIEIGNLVVRYAKRPSKFFDGKEYVWDKKAREYRRWARNRRGGLFFTRLDDEPEQAARSVGDDTNGEFYLKDVIDELEF
ncbi:MAG: hypothetical protein IJM30_11945 [Thermoguttaceae bacterium]|nr:hypothetical protein [Thermoguttaceae bacterium]